MAKSGTVFVFVTLFTTLALCDNLSWITVKTFVLNSIAFWNLTKPVIFLCDNFNRTLVQDLQVQLSDLYVSSLVLQRFEVDDVIKLQQSRVLPSDLIMIGNSGSIKRGVSEVLRLNILKYQVTSIFLCTDCLQLVFRYFEGPDIIGRLLLAHYQEADLIALNGMHYCYYNRYLIFHYVGVWNISNGFEVDLSFSVVTLHLNDAILKVLTGEIMPYVPPSEFKTSVEPPDGFCGEILRVLSEMFNFRVNVTVSLFKNIYGVSYQKNGSFTGLIGEFMDKKYDVGLGIFSRTPTRELVVEFTAPFTTGQNVIAVHFPSKNSARSWSFKPISLWISIFLVVFLTTLSYVLIVHREVELNPTIDLMSIIMSTWFLQGGVDAPKCCSSRIIYATSCLLFWTLMCFFNGALVSYLTLDSAKVFTTLAELVHSDYTFGATQDSSSVEWLRTSEDPYTLALLNRATFTSTIKEGSEIVCRQKKYAHLSGFAVFYSLLNGYDGTCQYYFIKEIVNDDPYHFVTQKNNVLSWRLSRGITRMRSSGLLVRLEKKYNLVKKVISSKSWENNNDQIHLTHLMIPFSLLLSGNCLALIALTCELCIYQQKIAKQN